MTFNDHHKLKGKHSFLGASKYHWLRYNEDKLISSYLNSKAAERGTELHDLAATLISLNQKLPKSKKTLNMYVNDAIGYKMDAEQILYFSDNCFGTADAISFRDNFLRIHDYKSGVNPGNMDQLLIYSAMFCLEYRVKPENIEVELRIYQNDEVLIHNPCPDEIRDIMDIIKRSDSIIEKIKKGERR